MGLLERPASRRQFSPAVIMPWIEAEGRYRYIAPPAAYVHPSLLCTEEEIRVKREGQGRQTVCDWICSFIQQYKRQN
jgi:hypothetical protein